MPKLFRARTRNIKNYCYFCIAKAIRVISIQYIKLKFTMFLYLCQNPMLSQYYRRDKSNGVSLLCVLKHQMPIRLICSKKNKDRG